MDLTQEILKLKKEKKAVILAHNYQRPEIQDMADYIGDSIELSRKAVEEKDAKMIVFSAVDFMAESAAILNPGKKVLLPCLGARCPMAQMLTVDEIKRAKELYPKAPVVLYVNTLAVCKAECDVCCTSANAVEVIKSLDAETVLFGPDKNLAEYVSEKTGKTLIPIPANGFCPTHLLFQPEDVKVLKTEHPDALSWFTPNAARRCEKSQISSAAPRKCAVRQRIKRQRLYCRHRRRHPASPPKRKPKQKLLPGLRRRNLPQHEADNAGTTLRLTERGKERCQGAGSSREESPWLIGTNVPSLIALPYTFSSMIVIIYFLLR